MSGEEAGIPFMVTAAMKQELRERGFTDDEISNLTPQRANHILKNGWTHKQWADYEETIQAGRATLKQASANRKGRKEAEVVPIRPSVAKLAERTEKVVEQLDAKQAAKRKADEERRKTDEELNDLISDAEETPRDRLKRIKAALEWVKPGDQNTVLKVGLALRLTEEESAPEVWAKWSGRSAGEWKSWVVPSATNMRVTPGFIYWMAQRAGWRYPMGHSGNRLETTVEQCERALIRGGAGIYRVGSALVHPVEAIVPAARQRTSKQVHLAPFNLHSLRSFQTKYVDWRGEEENAKGSPDHVTNAMLNRGGRSLFPPTTGVIMTPTMRHDGSLLIKPGYDAATGLILWRYPQMPSISPEPSRGEALVALNLLDGLLDEFPFVDGASRSVGLSAEITPVIRGALSCVPLHGLRAPAAGTGKSFLADIASAIAVGEPCPIMSMGPSEEELEKRLVQRLRFGGKLLSIDNIPAENVLGGDALCQFIERERVEPRILRTMEGVALVNNWTLLATGNNLRVSGDMTRRTLMGSMDARMERPIERKFKGNPVHEVLKDRGRYIAAALTVARAYFVAKQPGKLEGIGDTFAGWSDLVRSALVWLGRADPVATMDIARDEDPVRQERVNVLGAIAAMFQGPFLVKDLIRKCQGTFNDIVNRLPKENEDIEELRAALLSIAGPGQINPKRLGKWFSKNRGTIAGGLRLEEVGSDANEGVKKWQVVKVVE
jgi:putative DNA primase/helicase